MARLKYVMMALFIPIISAMNNPGIFRRGKRKTGRKVAV